MGCGFRIVFGYTQSDEISLLFHRDDAPFDRKLRKLISVLAGEASACFSLRLGVAACFDTRISQLPNAELVVEYFRWRQEDATRNALNGHCYWALRREGRDAQQATAELNALSVATKNELLFQRGINFNELPKWQRRGIGLYWEEFEKAGMNPLTGETRTALRRRIRVDMELPMREEYDALLRGMVLAAGA